MIGGRLKEKVEEEKRRNGLEMEGNIAPKEDTIRPFHAFSRIDTLSNMEKKQSKENEKNLTS